MYVCIYKCMKVLIIGLEIWRRRSLKHPKSRCATTGLRWWAIRMNMCQPVHDGCGKLWIAGRLGEAIIIIVITINQQIWLSRLSTHSGRTWTLLLNGHKAQRSWNHGDKKKPLKTKRLTVKQVGSCRSTRELAYSKSMRFLGKIHRAPSPTFY